LIINRPVFARSQVEIKMKKIAILGSTGSIGTQALEVISTFKDIFEVEILTAYNNVQLLIEQAEIFQPNAVVIANKRQVCHIVGSA
jgi:1-deoxy-D-xylulose-5-phosphate reductoisomerase